MEGWIAQDWCGTIHFFPTKPKQIFLNRTKTHWMWVIDENDGQTILLNNSTTAKRELLPNMAVNRISLIDMLGVKRGKNNKEGFGEWEGVSKKEPRKVRLTLELL